MHFSDFLLLALFFLAVSLDARMIVELGDTVLEVSSSMEDYGQLVGRRRTRPGWGGISKKSTLALGNQVGHNDDVLKDLVDSAAQVYQLVSQRIAASQPGRAESLRNGRGSFLLEKYGEAIMLAQHYRQDNGPVYRRQLSKKSDTVQPAVYRDLLPCVCGGRWGG